MSTPKKPLYLPVAIDGKRNMALAANALKVEPGVIAWGLLELWEHVWRSKRDTVGEFILDGCFGPDARVRDVLVAYEFIERTEDGWRVRGADLWLFGAAERGALGGRKTAEKGASLRNLKQNQPKQDRSTTEADTEADTEAPPKQEPKQLRSPPSTQHPTPIEESKAKAPPPSLPIPTAPLKEPADPLADPHAFFAQVQVNRAEEGLPRERPPRPEALSRWWSEMLMELNGRTELLPEMFQAFAADPFWQAKQPPLPFPGFMAQWRKYVPVQSAA